MINFLYIFNDKRIRKVKKKIRKNIYLKIKMKQKVILAILRR